MMQQSKYIIAPSQTYDGYTGFKPGSAAASKSAYRSADVAKCARRRS